LVLLTFDLNIRSGIGRGAVNENV